MNNNLTANERAKLLRIFGNAAFKPRKPGSTVYRRNRNAMAHNIVKNIFGNAAFAKRAPGTHVSYRPVPKLRSVPSPYKHKRVNNAPPLKQVNLSNLVKRINAMYFAKQRRR